MEHTFPALLHDSVRLEGAGWLHELLVVERVKLGRDVTITLAILFDKILAEGSRKRAEEIEEIEKTCFIVFSC
jgi:hypothetical protein